VLGEIVPSVIVNQGEVTGSSYLLPTRTSVVGLYVDWDLLDTGALSSAGRSFDFDGVDGIEVAKVTEAATLGGNATLAITRNYSTDRVRLRATLQTGAGLTNATTLDTEADVNPAQRAVFEFRVLPNTQAVIQERILDLFEDQFENIPLYVQLPASGIELFSGIYAVNESSGVTTDPATRLVFGFSTTETGFYVLPGSNSDFDDVDLSTFTGVDYYILVKTSGTVADVGSGVFETSGFVLGSSGLTAGDQFGAESGADDIPFLIIDAATGRVYVLDDSVLDGSTAPEVFELTIFTRVLLDTDSDTTTFEVNQVVSQDMIIFKNPSVSS
jgi:hypothetical protein